jgi:hypothetical protein
MQVTGFVRLSILSTVTNVDVLSPETETIQPPSSSSSNLEKQGRRGKKGDRDRGDRDRGDRGRQSPGTPSSLGGGLDDDRIDDVDDVSKPYELVAPVGVDKSPAPTRTKSQNFAASGPGDSVSVTAISWLGIISAFLQTFAQFVAEFLL